jgi:hypothetical protein
MSYWKYIASWIWKSAPKKALLEQMVITSTEFTLFGGVRLAPADFNVFTAS